ncbi:hypothetical protein AQUCO_09600004v1 [Aquilegia coerulea]|uniref:Uncharacterized protein n=1 Tax=Aquilegia coerulea TaxID=218851 RepID=A0A2G5C4F1_AQUCA|nr:hypothetical protein AQUCO_09600004v1 [Aquilegia coerulea]
MNRKRKRWRQLLVICILQNFEVTVLIPILLGSSDQPPSWMVHKQLRPHWGMFLLHGLTIHINFLIVPRAISSLYFRVLKDYWLESLNVENIVFLFDEESESGD